MSKLVLLQLHHCNQNFCFYYVEKSKQRERQQLERDRLRSNTIIAKYYDGKVNPIAFASMAKELFNSILLFPEQN